MAKNKPSWIVLHHSVSKPETTVEEIRSWHKARGYSDIGYHYIIRMGSHGPETCTGRVVTEIGAHCPGLNGKSIGICICGNWSETDPSEYTELWEHAKSLLISLRLTYGIPASRVIGHREAPRQRTECPGLRVDLETLRQSL